uniref:Major facilitator superfamily (MFS) profile domain-containing protein n=1 Tax=Daphnia galeata TaxID=27404 RepID=A0A8J2RL78_9CRUS|nr:unnamed protein product [Daphnia galeata]
MGAPKSIENEKPPNQEESTSSSCLDGDAFNADIILNHLGKFGWFQLKYLLCIGYGLLFPTSCILIYVFVGAVPAHRCFVEGCDNPDEPVYKANWLVNQSDALSNLLMTPRAWRCTYQDFEKIPNASQPECAYSNYTVNATCHQWVFDQSVFTSTIVTDYLLVCEDSWKITFGSFITMLGVLLGAFFLGPLPDLIGRRTSVVVLGTWIASFGIGSCFAPNFDAFAALRFLTGMGGVSVMQALIIWGLEAQRPEMRIKFICLIYCFQSIGNLISGGLAYLIRDWVTLQLCIFVPMGTMIVTYFILPESTRWLTVKKRYPEAKEIYEKAAKLNKKEIPPHLLVIPADTPTKAVEAGEADGVPPAVASHDSNPIGSALKVLKTRCLLVRLLILCGTWLAQFLCYYGLSYAASNLSADIHFNYILVILVEIPAYVTGMFAMDYFGRRPILNFTLIVGGSFCLVAGLISKEFNTVIIVFSLMGKFCTSMLTVANNAFTFELFPTVSRGITIALCSTSGKVGAIIAPYIAAMGLVNRSLPYVIFGAISLAIGVLTLLLPESKGRATPATVQEAIDLEKTRIDIRSLWRSKQPASTDAADNSAIPSTSS